MSGKYELLSFVQKDGCETEDDKREGKVAKWLRLLCENKDVGYGEDDAYPSIDVYQLLFPLLFE